MARHAFLVLRAGVGSRGLVGLDRRGSLDDGRELGENLGIGPRLIRLGVLAVVPEADGVDTLRVDQRHFLLETFLFAEHRKNFLLKQAGELLLFTVLDLKTDVACESHFTTPESFGERPSSGDPRLRKEGRRRQ